MEKHSIYEKKKKSFVSHYQVLIIFVLSITYL